MRASDEIDNCNWTWGHIAASLCHGSSRSVRHSQPVPGALVRFSSVVDRLQDRVQSWFCGIYFMPFYGYSCRIGSRKSFRKIEFELIIDGTYVLNVQECRGSHSCRILWVGSPVVQRILLHEGSHAHLLSDLRLVGPFSWSSANGAVSVSCGYHMLNFWNVVSYLNTISPSNGDDQIFHVATVLFASVVLCRERIGICSPSYFSSSHPMIFDM